MTRMYNPSHPGKLLKEFMGDTMTVKGLAEHLKSTRATVSMIINGRQGISADMALRLAGAFGTSPDVWLNMQTQYDLWQAEQRERPSISPIKINTAATSQPNR